MTTPLLLLYRARKERAATKKISCEPLRLLPIPPIRSYSINALNTSLGDKLCTLFSLPLLKICSKERGEEKRRERNWSANMPDRTAVVGFVGLDKLSLRLASSLIRSGYHVQAYQVCLPSSRLCFYHRFAYTVVLFMLGSLFDRPLLCKLQKQNFVGNLQLISRLDLWTTSKTYC